MNYEVHYNIFNDEDIQQLMLYWNELEVVDRRDENDWDTECKGITEIRAINRVVDIVGVPINLYPNLTKKIISSFQSEDIEGPHYLTKYPNSGFHSPHIDSGVYNGIDRDKVITIQLSDEREYEGGNLIIGGDIAPKDKGCVIIYEGGVEHEVTPILSGERFSLTECMGNPIL